MKLSRRGFLHLAVVAAAFGSTARQGWAQTYPNRPVRLIVPATAGGVSDLYGRLFARWLSDRLGQQFIVENRPGAGGNIGTEAAVRADPDGYTLLQTSSANAWNVALYDNVGFDFIRDLAPIASTTRGINVVVVNPSFPARTLAELVAYAKANPGKVNMASGGVGSSQHVFGELFKAMAGVDMLHVPYRGQAQALTDLIAGQVDVVFDNLPTSREHVRAGKLRALAVTSATRTDLLPDVPTVAEFVPGYEASGWLGFGAPRGTPAAIIEKLNGEINAAIANPAIRTRVRDLGSALVAMSPSEFDNYIAAYTAKWTKVIRDANIKAS